MTTARVTARVVIGTLLLFGVASAQDQEKRTQRSELPSAVQKAVAPQSQGATIRGFSQETENGKTFYETEFITSGQNREVLMDPDGDKVEVEEEAAMDSLSPSVRAALKSNAGSGNILKVESLTKKRKLIGYEAKFARTERSPKFRLGCKVSLWHTNNDGYQTRLTLSRPRAPRMDRA